MPFPLLPLPLPFLLLLFLLLSPVLLRGGLLDQAEPLGLGFGVVVTRDVYLKRFVGLIGFILFDPVVLSGKGWRGSAWHVIGYMVPIGLISDSFVVAGNHK